MAVTRFALIAAAAALLCAAVVLAQGTVSLRVQVDDRIVPLTVAAGQSFVDAATRFCEQHALDQSLNVGRLVAALEQESARAARTVQRKPLVTLPLLVRDRNVNLEHFAGDHPDDTVTRFLREQNLPEVDRQLLSVALRRELELLKPQPQIIATVQVEADLGRGFQLVPMHVYDGQTPQQAAEAFVTEHNVDRRFIPDLVRAINDRLTPAPAPPVFTLPVLVDGQRRELPYYAGQEPAAVASKFCAGLGINAEQCQKIRSAIISQLRTNQAAANERAPLRTVSIQVDNALYDLEYEQGLAVEVLASGFCREKWNELYAVLSRDAATDVTMQDCVVVLADLLRSRV